MEQEQPPSSATIVKVAELQFVPNASDKEYMLHSIRLAASNTTRVTSAMGKAM